MPVTTEPIHETFHLGGDGAGRVVEQLKTLIHEGNVRRLVLKDRSGRTLIEIPLTVGVVGAMLIPVWAAITAVAAVVADATIVVERHDRGTTP